MECLLYDCRISPGNFKLQLSDLEFNHIKTAVRIGGGFTTGFEKYWRMIFIFKKVMIFTTPVLVTSNNYSTHIHNNKWNFFVVRASLNLIARVAKSSIYYQGVLPFKCSC